MHQQKWARQTWTRYLRDSSPASSYDSVSIGVWQPWLSPFRRDDAAPNDGVIIHAVIFPVKGFLNKVFAILICMDMVCRSRKYYSPGFCRLFCGKSFSDGRFFWIALVLYAGNTKIICQRKATAAQWVFGSYNLSLPNSPAKKAKCRGSKVTALTLLFEGAAGIETHGFAIQSSPGHRPVKRAPRNSRENPQCPQF